MRGDMNPAARSSAPPSTAASFACGSHQQFRARRKRCRNRRRLRLATLPAGRDGTGIPRRKVHANRGQLRQPRNLRRLPLQQSKDAAGRSRTTPPPPAHPPAPAGETESSAAAHAARSTRWSFPCARNSASFAQAGRPDTPHGRPPSSRAPSNPQQTAPAGSRSCPAAHSPPLLINVLWQSPSSPLLIQNIRERNIRDQSDRRPEPHPSRSAASSPSAHQSVCVPMYSITSTVFSSSFVCRLSRSGTHSPGSSLASCRSRAAVEPDLQIAQLLRRRASPLHLLRTHIRRQHHVLAQRGRSHCRSRLQRDLHPQLRNLPPPSPASSDRSATQSLRPA